jgi:hypothetical protein
MSTVRPRMAHARAESRNFMRSLVGPDHLHMLNDPGNPGTITPGVESFSRIARDSERRDASVQPASGSKARAETGRLFLTISTHAN